MAFLEVNFFSDVLGMCMPMYVVLPQKTRGMIGVDNKAGDGRYPTLYLLHGMSDDHTIWMRRTSIERYADEKGIAVVMPTTNLGWYTDMKYGFKYRTFIGEELPKICRSFFPGMSDKREDTYVAGLSMGGYGAMAIALTYPETFCYAGTLSGALIPYNFFEGDDNTYWTDIFGTHDEIKGSKNDIEALAVKVKESGLPMPKIYQWCGTEDFLYKDNCTMRDIIKNLGYELTYEESSGIHSWYYWDQKIQTFLDLIFKDRAERS